ncbi:hypothetical protein GCM10023085_65480 [Actinomadura viridis]|uniref:Uncharacterized protein n=1 Tax=Actinomadura viridis TaxID=58110 RepID=A0A931GRN3_9ACTN|nr:hypothetical protein [Actinomadura viridis]MBG6093036.1 hypothetical protein [Actinomadura viridis]
MPKITDYVRAGFRRRRRPWHHTELPEWWDVAVWVGGVGVIALLVLSALFERDDPSAGPAAGGGGAPRYVVQTLDPRGPSATPGPGGGGASTAPTGSPPTGSAPAGVSAKDFTASAAVRVPVTGGGTTVVPAGARNVAAAAARATATGDWAGIPFIGAARPPAAPARPGSVVGTLTVADPTVTGNDQYRFSATIARDGTARPEAVQITVGRGPSGYAIRAA